MGAMGRLLVDPCLRTSAREWEESGDREGESVSAERIQHMRSEVWDEQAAKHDME